MGNTPAVNPFRSKYPIIVGAIAAFALVLVFGALCHAEPDIYFYIDENGHYHFSNVPTSDRYVPSEIFLRDRRPLSTGLANSAYDAIIADAAEVHGVDFALVKAVIKAESDFNPYAISPKGAQGLMQIMPANFESFDVSDPFDPSENIRAGTRYLGYLMNRYNNDLRLALAAYNAGPGVVDRYGGIPPFRETREYVRRVLASYDQLRYDRPPGEVGKTRSR